MYHAYMCMYWRNVRVGVTLVNCRYFINAKDAYTVWRLKGTRVWYEYKVDVRIATYHDLRLLLFYSAVKRPSHGYMSSDKRLTLSLSVKLRLHQAALALSNPLIRLSPWWPSPTTFGEGVDEGIGDGRRGERAARSMSAVWERWL